jgi:hypothetical protein
VKNQGRKWIAVGGAALVVALIGLDVQSTKGYPRYRQDQTGGYCVDCHGHFIDNYSPQGTQFGGEGKMGMHMYAMGTDCLLCHMAPGEIPYIGASAGTANNPGVGCNGCHGRDYGGDLGNSGVGLRAHHVTNGVTECGPGCHDGDPPPLPEHVMPIYYGTPDTLAFDPCNPLIPPDTYGENFSADEDNHRGQDNDGDNQYDESDADCGGCPWDLHNNQDVGISDLLALLAAWGTNPAGPPDFDADGTVGISDLLELLAHWGACP